MRTAFSDIIGVQQSSVDDSIQSHRALGVGGGCNDNRRGHRGGSYYLLHLVSSRESVVRAPSIEDCCRLRKSRYVKRLLPVSSQIDASGLQVLDHPASAQSLRKIIEASGMGILIPT
jgi:hypothetical protein